jgi:hypothetical protein
VIRPGVAAALLSAALAMCVASNASAAHRTHRMTFEFATLVAVDYWAKRDVTVPCKPAANLLTWKQTKGWGYETRMLADRPACTVDITPWADIADDPDLAWMYCQEVVHEIGHLAGLEHSYGGVMAADPWVVPFGCAHPLRWAVSKGWREPPRWVRRSTERVQRLWLRGLQTKWHKHYTQPFK